MEHQNLVLSEKVTNNSHVEKERFAKVGKDPINIDRMLIFHVAHGNKLFQDLI